MGTGLINTAMTGLQVAQLGLMTTEHNISNASTPGYNRQRTIQASNVAMLTGSGYVGQGAHVATISRMYDSFLSSQVNTAQSTSSQLTSYYSQIQQINNMVADANSGVSPALQDFFSGVQQVASYPSQLSSRQAMISSAQALVSRYQGLQSNISQMYDSINSQVTSTVATINSYATQISNLNQSIVAATAATSQPPNDLLDQRDELVSELNKLVNVTTTTNTDGSFNVYVGSGQQLVVGSQVMTMTSEPSASDPTRITIGLQTAGGAQQLPESLITGGSLGGLLNFRSETLDPVANELGRNAASLALTFNAQYALGQDLLGQSAGNSSFTANFFSVAQPTVYAASTNSTTSPATISATLSPASLDGVYTLSNNSGTYTLTRQSDGTSWSGTSLTALQAAVPTSEGVTLTGATVGSGSSTQIYSAAANGANFYTKLTASDYRLSYDGSNYTMTRLSDNKQWSDSSLSNLSKTISGSEGFSFSLSTGTIAAGDNFVIKPVASAVANLAVNSTVAADARLVAAAMPFSTAATSTNTGTGTISAGVSTLGIGSPALGASGVTLTYSSAGTGTLALSGVPSGANVSLTVGSTTTVYSGASPLSIPYSAGATISFAGISFSVSGNLNNGDSFTVGKNASGVSDGRNALALGQLQSQNTMSGKTASYEAAYAQMVSDVGNTSREVQVKNTAQTALLQQATDAQSALSGVNLDEEAANLLKYQQAYQASAKMLDIGSKLFDTLLAIGS